MQVSLLMPPPGRLSLVLSSVAGANAVNLILGIAGAVVNFKAHYYLLLFVFCCFDGWRRSSDL